MKKKEEKMPRKVKKSYVNSRGEEVPAKFVRPVDRRRDAVVEKLYAAAVKQEQALKAFKKAALDQMYAFMRFSDDVQGVDRDGWRGNLRLTSYDGNVSAEIKVIDYLDFDEGIQQAQTIINTLVQEWSSGSRQEILLLIQRAFRLDESGRRNINAILALRELQIDHPLWKKAMSLIEDARKIVRSKAYLRISRRTGPEGAWEAVPLDISAVRVDE